MWEVRVTQKYMSDYGTNLEETVVFRASNLTKAGVIVDIFKGYGIGKMSYSITQKQEEEDNE